MKLLRSIQELVETIQDKKTVYLYGAGKISEKLLELMQERQSSNKISGIFVTEKENEVATLYGIPVDKFSEEEIEENDIVIIAVSARYRQAIYEILIGAEIKNILALTDDFFQNSTGSEQFFYERLKRIKEMIGQLPQKEKLKKDILFLSPPYWDVYSPFSAVPCLVAKLKEEGFSCTQFDVGIHCIHTLLEKKWDVAVRNVLSEAFYERSFKSYVKNKYENVNEYRNALSFLMEGYKNLNEIKKRYTSMNPVQKRAVDAVYSYIYNSDSTFIDFDKCKDIERAIASSGCANLLETLEKNAVIQMFSNIPDVVGISVTSTYQFIPACIIAKIIKESFPNVKIIMGGSCADLFAKSSYEPKTDIYNYFDYFTVGEGETALVRLMHYLHGAGTLEEIPNLLFFKKNGEIELTEQIIEDVETLPAPCYDGLDLSLYLAPETILPYQTSRGCHYGQCAFCNHDEKYRHNYRTKNMKKVVTDLLWLSKTYHTKCFQFVDEAIRPDCFKEMIEEMDKYPEFKEMRWIFYSRVSRQYDGELVKKAYENGCRMVMFGIESLNQRLLKFIKKGISAETSKYCLKLFHEAGIKTHAWLLCNLPSETLKEAKKDMEDVYAIKEDIDGFSIGAFMLQRNTDMYDHPDLYNITKINEEDELRFESHNNGEIINKEAMLEFKRKEYATLQKKLYSVGNRYTNFFEQD